MYRYAQLPRHEVGLLSLINFSWLFFSLMTKILKLLASQGYDISGLLVKSDRRKSFAANSASYAKYAMPYGWVITDLLLKLQLQSKIIAGSFGVPRGRCLQPSEPCTGVWLLNRSCAFLGWGAYLSALQRASQLLSRCFGHAEVRLFASCVGNDIILLPTYPSVIAWDTKKITCKIVCNVHGWLEPLRCHLSKVGPIGRSLHEAAS